jgi:hypothetical protein
LTQAQLESPQDAIKKIKSIIQEKKDDLENLNTIFANIPDLGIGDSGATNLSESIVLEQIETVNKAMHTLTIQMHYLDIHLNSLSPVVMTGVMQKN